MSRFSVVLGSSVAVGLVVGLAGCGQVQPVEGASGFGRSQTGETRVFQAYRQTRSSRVVTVELPKGTRHARLHLSCAGTGRGFLRVGVLGGEGSVPCGKEVASSAVIGLSDREDRPEASEVRVRVAVPRGSRWSVAVDVGPGAVDPTLPD